MVNTSVSDSNANNLNTPPVAPASPNPVAPQTPTIAPLSNVDAQLPVTENPEDLDTRWTRWRCLVCNYTYEGREPLKKCPRCGNEDPDKFDDVD